MQRLISANPSDTIRASAEELKDSILASAGRVILGETVVTAAPLLEGVTNAEVMAGFGADLLLLNELDVNNPSIMGFEYHGDNLIGEIKRLTGRPIGINLEPIDLDSEIKEGRVSIQPGRVASVESFIKAKELGIDFILLTGNPATGVANSSILKSIHFAREYFKGLIFAGKMHRSGINEEIIDLSIYSEYIRNGADGVIIPSPGTVPGVTLDKAYEACQTVLQLGGIVIGAIGTSQESADPATIRTIALMNQQVGVSIHHIGDGSYGRTPDPENLMQLGVTIRGKRHHYFKMSQSILR